MNFRGKDRRTLYGPRFASASEYPEMKKFAAVVFKARRKDHLQDQGKWGPDPMIDGEIVEKGHVL